MTFWEIEYFPPAGVNSSPGDYIKNLALKNKQEAILIIQRIEVASKIKQMHEWPSGWKLHKIMGKVQQINAGKQHRVMFCTYEDKLVVLHICKKVGQKTRSNDIKCAEKNHTDYFASLGEER